MACDRWHVQACGIRSSRTPEQAPANRTHTWAAASPTQPLFWHTQAGKQMLTHQYALRLQLLQGHPLVLRQQAQVGVEKLREAGAAGVRVRVLEHVQRASLAPCRGESLPEQLLVVGRVCEGVQQVGSRVALWGEAQPGPTHHQHHAVGPLSAPQLLGDGRVVAHAVHQQAGRD